MLATTVLALFAAVSVNAINITSPADDATLEAGVPVTIEWTSVNTDPDSFTLAIQIPSPFSTKTIAEDVETSAGSYTFTPDASLVGDGDYRINFIDPKTNGILAQSGEFEIEEGKGTTAASSAASGAASSAAATSKAAASGVTSVAAASGSAAANASGATSGNPTGAIPNASTTPASGANALVPSLALVGAAVVAAVL